MKSCRESVVDGALSRHEKWWSGRLSNAPSTVHPTAPEEQHRMGTNPACDLVCGRLLDMVNHQNIHKPGFRVQSKPELLV